MDILNKLSRFTLTALAGGVLMTSGCFELPHADLRYAATVSPAQYCPGDTVTASYNVTLQDACVSRPGFNCADFMPNVDMSSTPDVFPPRRFNAFTGSVQFTPTVDTFAVSFTPDRSPIVYPIVDPMSRRTFATIATPPHTATATRINGPIVRELSHGGMCAGSTPAHAPAALPGMPEVSNRLRAQEICNPNSVPITITLSSATSPSFAATLAPGACADPSPPGVPGTGSDARIVEVSSSTVDPNAICNPLQGSTPPASLRTRITLACGM
jgi:hypothetical protein